MLSVRHPKFAAALFAAAATIANLQAITYNGAQFTEPPDVGVPGSVDDRSFENPEDPNVRAYFGTKDGSDTGFFWGGHQPVNPGPVFTEANGSDYEDNTSYFQFFSYYGSGDSIILSSPVGIGEFQYFNGSSSAGTGVSDVDLKLTINGEEYVFPLGIRNIYNSENSDAGADKVRFLERSKEISIGGGQFLNLAFDWDGAQDGALEETDPDTGLSNAFSVEELATVTATLYAWIGEYSAPVPEPGTSAPDGGTTVALLSMVLLGLGAASRKTQKK